MNDDHSPELVQNVELEKDRKRSRFISSCDNSEDEKYDVSVNENFVWKEENHTPTIHDFSATSGATVNTEGMSRREVFELFFNDEVVQKILLEINKYGAANGSSIQITENELKVYIALSILMGIIQKPTIQSYWSTDKSIETPFFKSIMSRKRFIDISANLNFVDDNYNSNESLIKIREISDIITKNFIRIYKPHKNISIVESLMHCKSPSHCLQSNRARRANFGIKFYKLCDSHTRYIHNFKIYIRKHKTNSGSNSRNIVMKLMKESELLHQGYCLYIDNWYSSPALYRELYNMQTNVCGTARANRKGMPKELKLIGLEKGEAIVYSTEDMAAIKWKDKKDVVILTTIHSLDFSVSGKVNPCSGEKILKPTAVIDYNKNMGEFDIGDQMLSKFQTIRRCKKAYNKIFFYLVDMILLNSYILYKKTNATRSLHVYKQKLAEEIIIKYLKKKRIRETPSKNDSIARYSGQHFPTRIPPTEAKGRKTSKRCNVCLSMSIRRETVFKCDMCDVPLCIDHFKDYHIK